MDGQIHYRQVGRVRPEMPSPVVQRPRQGRAVFGHAIPWGVPTKITPRKGGEPYQEWLVRGSVRAIARVPFSLRHQAEGGTRVGWVVRLSDTKTWLDFAALIDNTPAGDAFLESLNDDGDRLPVSIAFEPVSSVTYPEGIQRTRVFLREIAVVDTAAYEGAYLFAVGSLQSFVAMEAEAS